MFEPVKPSSADRLVEAMDLYARSCSIVRDCVSSKLLGVDTPASYDRLESDAIENGEQSLEARQLDSVGNQVDAIMRSLRLAGIKISETKEAAPTSIRPS